MVDEKKFLDQNGIEYLWSQLSLEDYPNNETLIAVLNAIDTTKADKNEIPTLTSELTNDSNFIDSTTLNDYYNKTEVDAFHGTLEDYVDNQVAALVNSAPETLDTLGELAAAFEENKEVVGVLNDAIATKYSSSNPPPYPVTSVNGKTGEVNLTSEDVGAISQNDLQEATNRALEQAKKSGEFDGADGQPGVDGITPRVGSNGNWFIGDNDTGIPATGPAGGQGLPGTPGEDGAKGDKGDKGDTGAKGDKGDKGDPGEPGVDGADYVLTDADKSEIAEMAAALVDAVLLAIIGTGVVE